MFTIVLKTKCNPTFKLLGIHTHIYEYIVYVWSNILYENDEKNKTFLCARHVPKLFSNTSGSFSVAHLVTSEGYRLYNYYV